MPKFGRFWAPDFGEKGCPNYRLVVLESGLGLESGLKSIFAGLGLGLGLGLEGFDSKSFFQVLCIYKKGLSGS